MSQKQASRYCPHCDRRVLALGTKANHVLHLLLSLVSCGLWLPVWLIVAAATSGNYRCARCGTGV